MVPLLRLLLVEDEPEMAILIANHTAAKGFALDHMGCLAYAKAAMALASYALVILDRRLPDGDGLALIPDIRKLQPGVPVIVLTALDRVSDKVSGLDAGADDYLAKPFDIDELMARIRAALRRPGGQDLPVIRCGQLSFEPSTREVLVSGDPVVLNRRELVLLEILIMRAGRVVQRETLISQLYGCDDEIQSNALDSHVSRLRGKLADLNAGVSIFPIRGVGYMLDEQPAPPCDR